MNHDSLQSYQITQPTMKSGKNHATFQENHATFQENHATYQKITQPIKRIFPFTARNHRMNHDDSFLGL